MKHIGLKSSKYINFDVENNGKDPKLKVSNHVRILKYKNFFSKSYTPNGSEEVFLLKKLKTLHDGNM